MPADWNTIEKLDAAADSVENKIHADWVNTDTSGTVICEFEIATASADEYWINDETWSHLITEIDDSYERKEEKIQKWRTKMQGMYNNKTSRYNPVRHFTDIWNG